MVGSHNHLTIVVAFFVILFHLNPANGSFCDRFSATSDSLRQLIVVTRHGARTPLHTFPNDIYQKDYWSRSGGYGQLTQIGMTEQYQLGQFVRKCYGNFGSSDITAYSTNYDWTLMSGQAFLAGLVTSATVDAELTGFLRSLRPMRALPLKFQNVECNTACTNKIIKRLRSRFSEKDKQHRQVLEYIAEKAGLNSSSYIDIGSLMPDVIAAEKAANLPLVEWLRTNETMVRLFEEMGDAIFAEYFSASLPERVIAVSSRSLNFFIEIMKNVTLKNQHSKLVLISSHDSYLAGILAGLGDFNGRIPPFSSALFVELSSKGNVSVFYRNTTTLSPYRINIRNGCGQSCSLEKFAESLQDAMKKLSDNWNLKSTLPFFVRPRNVIAFCLVLSAIVIIIFVRKLIKSKQGRNRNIFFRLNQPPNWSSTPRRQGDGSMHDFGAANDSERLLGYEDEENFNDGGDDDGEDTLLMMTQISADQPSTGQQPPLLMTSRMPLS